MSCQYLMNLSDQPKLDGIRIFHASANYNFRHGIKLIENTNECIRLKINTLQETLLDAKLKTSYILLHLIRNKLLAFCFMHWLKIPQLF